MRETILYGYDKDDLNQECFLQLQKAVERYNPEMGVPFESYFYIVLRGWRANQNRVKTKMELVFGEDEPFFLQDERVDIEKDVERKLRMEEVCRSLEKLKEEERKIIEAFYFQNMKIPQIAKILNLPVRTVQYKKRHALGELRKILGPRVYYK